MTNGVVSISSICIYPLNLKYYSNKNNKRPFPENELIWLYTVSTIIIIFLTHYTNVKYNSNISPNNSKIRDDRVKLLQGNWVL